MNEKVQSVDFYVPKFNHELKGHAKIELRNPYRTQIVEHDNVVQSNIVAQRLRRMGALNDPIWIGSWSPLWKCLFGGIFLFDTSIVTDTEYMPQGVTMIGNGAADVSNTSTPLCMGSWDSIKSSVNATTCTQVYNWTQTQGNGSIASVCLTSKVGGYIGYGNTDNVKKGSMNTWSNFGINYYNIGSISSSEGITVAFYNNHAIRIRYNNTNKTVNVEMIPVAISRYNLLETTRTLTLNYTTALTGDMTKVAFIPDGKGKFAISESKTVAPNESKTVLVVDLSNETLTEYSVTNNTSETWNSATYGNWPWAGDLCGFDGNHVYFANTRSSSATVYKIRLSDSAVVGSISGVNTSTPPTRDDALRIPVMPFTKNHKVVYSNNNWCLWDEINNTKYILNMGNQFYEEGSYPDYRYSYIGYDEGLNAMSNMPGFDHNTVGIFCSQNPMYLGTINNLAESVTKTSEDSMTVTYTLEKVSN